MRVTRSYPRTALRRLGQVNHRVTPPPRSTDSVLAITHDLSCQFIVTQRKGWGSTGPTQSMSLSPAGVEQALTMFPAKSNYRYKINVYLKDK